MAPKRGKAADKAAEEVGREVGSSMSQESPGSPSEDYESMTVAALKSKAQELGVAQSGNKKDGAAALVLKSLRLCLAHGRSRKFQQFWTLAQGSRSFAQDLVERLRALAQPKKQSCKWGPFNGACVMKHVPRKRAAPAPPEEEKAPKRGWELGEASLTTCGSSDRALQGKAESGPVEKAKTQRIAVLGLRHTSHLQPKRCFWRKAEPKGKAKAKAKSRAKAEEATATRPCGVLVQLGTLLLSMI